MGGGASGHPDHKISVFLPHLTLKYKFTGCTALSKLCLMMPTSLLILIPLLRPYSALATQYTMRQVHGTSGAWCMVNCTLFDFVQSSLRENKFDNTMSDVLIAICCSVWRQVKDVARHCAVLCIFALLHKRVDTNVQ